MTKHQRKESNLPPVIAQAEHLQQDTAFLPAFLITLFEASIQVNLSSHTRFPAIHSGNIPYIKAIKALLSLFGGMAVSSAEPLCTAPQHVAKNSI
jgi:hypothetical protein